MRYYFLGVAGTAMASLAALLKRKGHEVWGSDAGIYPPMSDFLAAEKIPVWSGYDPAHLQTPFDVAVIGNALSRGNPEIEAILDQHLPFTSLPELIRDEFIRHHTNIVITGTHGKTTTTAMMGWVLQQAGLDPTCLIGGVSDNFGASVRLGSGKYFVIEGDEYDSAFFDKQAKFLHYFPDYLIINNLEFDHADIYPDLAAIQGAFRKLMKIVPSQGLVVANGTVPAVEEVLSPHFSRIQRLGPAKTYDWGYQLLESGPQGVRFAVTHGSEVWPEFCLQFPGEFMVQNAIAVITVAYDIGIPPQTICKALASFSGVRRRMDYWGEFHGASVYDDFAHHPTAIRVTLQAMKEKFPDRRLVALFEPRTNTTVRKVFQQALAEAFAPAEVVILTPIHRGERLGETERLSLPQLAADLRARGKTVYCLDDCAGILPLLETVLQQDDLLVLLTNGGLGGQYQSLRALIREPLPSRPV